MAIPARFPELPSAELHQDNKTEALGQSRCLKIANNTEHEELRMCKPPERRLSPSEEKHLGILLELFPLPLPRAAEVPRQLVHEGHEWLKAPIPVLKHLFFLLVRLTSAKFHFTALALFSGFPCQFYLPNLDTEGCT